MYSHTTDTICAITGTHPANLKRWMRQGLITRQTVINGWSDNQLTEIRSLVALTATGATLQEIKLGQKSERPVCTSGWAARKGDMLWQLEFGTTKSLFRQMNMMANDYSGDDFIFQLLRPLSHWLHADLRQGSTRRLERFEQSVQQQADRVMRASARRNNSVPLFLEAVSVRNETEIWLEAIRLSAMGFRVDVSVSLNGQPATLNDLHQHHVFWCGAGISPDMQHYFDQERAAGKPVMLSGPDQTIQCSQEQSHSAA